MKKFEFYLMWVPFIGYPLLFKAVFHIHDQKGLSLCYLNAFYHSIIFVVTILIGHYGI